MISTEFMDLINALEIEEKRKDSPQLLEIIIRNDSLDDLIRISEQYISPVMKPTSKVKRFLNHYGGIRKGQTVFFQEDEKTVTAGLIWPWSAGGFFTIKFFLEEKSKYEALSASVWTKFSPFG